MSKTPPTPRPVTPTAVRTACEKAFPGVELKVTESAGLVEVTFAVWNFEVVFTAVTEAMHFQDKKETGRHDVRFRWPRSHGHHHIRSVQNLEDMRDVEASLKWLLEYVNGVAAAIAMSQVDQFDHPSGLLGGGTDIP